PRSISSLYDLVNSSVAIPSGSSSSSQTTFSVGQGGAALMVQTTTEQTTITMPSPLNDPNQLRQLLPLLLDKTTTGRGPQLPARVNVNTAPREVLAALPGLTEADVQTIIEHRPSVSNTDAPDPIYQTPAWLITEANLPVATLKTLERYITARTQVYRV